METRRRISHREYERIYREWIASIEREAAKGDAGAIADLEFLRAHSGEQRETVLCSPLPFEPERSGRKSDEEHDLVQPDPADHAVDTRTAIDELEPLAPEESDLGKIGEAFTSALVWASQAKSLVEMGWRMHAMMRVFRPALTEGMALEARLDQERELRRSLSGGSRIAGRVGECYRNVLAWCRRCNSLSQLGQRGFAMIYVMRRDLIGKLNTNAALGALSNKTRQAFNKIVQDFRDSHYGFRNGVMRGEETRLRCKIAQTSES